MIHIAIHQHSYVFHRKGLNVLKLAMFNVFWRGRKAYPTLVRYTETDRFMQSGQVLGMV